MSLSDELSNEKSTASPSTLTLSAEERIEFLASIIVDKIHADMQSGNKLLKQLKTEE